MAIRPNSEERSFGADRERQREVSNESGRSARSSNADSGTDDTSENGSARTRSNRGFASMDRSKQREIASKGGRAAHQKGTAHEFDSSEARAAGRKGGVTVSRNREHMAAIGRRGGEARGANRAARLQQTGDTPSASSQSSAQRFQGDREVGVGANGTQPSSSASAPGTARQSGNSLGGERNTGAANAERNVERP
ncbi:MAG TPA: KGG domain-containing protein [Gemmatimonadaceae bacterium]|nr:KGG domain-containing protein [Gemmatimonadaceae bacterium]